MVWQRGPFVLLLLGVSSPSIHWPASFSPSIEHRWILKILTLVCCLSTLETLGSSVEKLQLELCLTCGRHCFGFLCSSMLVSNGSSAPHLSNHELLRQCGAAWRRSVPRGFWSPSFFTGPFSFRVSFPLFGFTTPKSLCGVQVRWVGRHNNRWSANYFEDHHHQKTWKPRSSQMETLDLKHLEFWDLDFQITKQL